MAKSNIKAKTFVRTLRIFDRQKSRVDWFNPIKAQDELLEVLQLYNRVIVFKARRLGISTLIRSWQTFNWLTTTEPLTFALMAHAREAAEEIGRMDERFYDNLPKPLKRKLSKSNTSTKRIAKTGATLKVFTAGSKGGTRAFEAYMAHLSEGAFYDDLQETLNTVLPTVGEGQVVIESTANLYGDKFHELVKGAQRTDGKREPGPNGWTLVFFPWNEHPEYQIDVPSDFRLGKEEARLKQDYHLSNRQLAWRRREVRSMGLAAFRREYPLTIDEAFQTASSNYIDRVAIDAISSLNLGNMEERWYPDFDKDGKFIMGVDVAEGVGGDYSSITVTSTITRQPVYHFRSNTIRPETLAEKAFTLATSKFNLPLIIVEKNNHGILVLYRLRQLKYKKLWLDEDGNEWKTTSSTRPLLFGTLRELIEEGMFDKLDKDLVEELKAIQLINGRPDHPPNGNDDLSVSFALTLVALRKTPLGGYFKTKNHTMEQHLAKMRAKHTRRALPWTPN